MLFGMVERGMDAEVIGDKGKLRGQVRGEGANKTAGDEAMWAIMLTKELWRKSVWSVVTTVLPATFVADPSSVGPTQRPYRSSLLGAFIPS